MYSTTDCLKYAPTVFIFSVLSELGSIVLPLCEMQISLIDKIPKPTKRIGPQRGEQKDDRQEKQTPENPR